MEDHSDGKYSLARESRYGLMAAFLVAGAIDTALTFLASVDLSSLTGWTAKVAALAVAGATGLLTAYRTANR